MDDTLAGLDVVDDVDVDGPPAEALEVDLPSPLVEVVAEEPVDGVSGVLAAEAPDELDEPVDERESVL